MRGGRVLVLSAIVGLGLAATVQAQSAPVLSGPQAAAACAPSHGLPPAPLEGLRILGVQDTSPRLLYGPNDLVVVNGGMQSGVQVNQDYFIRRAFSFGWAPRAGTEPQSIHTTGWLRIVAVNDATAIGQIQSICDGVVSGDYLEPFVAPAVIENGAPSTPATLDFSSLGRVKFGDEERRLGAAGDFMLVEGGDVPLTPGVRVALYRDLHVAGLPLAAIGEGIIVSVENGTPLMRISSAKDAIQTGDYVVRHK
jgi:hypothetical protein